VTPDAHPPAATTSTSRSRRRFIPFALLGIMTVGTGLAAFFAVDASSTPSEAVASALTNSLRFKSAAITLSVGIDEAGGSATINAKGVTDFDTGATAELVQVASSNQRISEKVVSDGSTIYIHLDGGIIAKVVTGKSWLSLPSRQSAAGGLTAGTGAGTQDAILGVLSATGNDVSDLGASLVDGDTVHLYSVHLTRSQINRDIAQERLPQFMRQVIATVHVPAVTYTLAINGANQLTQLKATVQVNAVGQHVREHLTEGFAHYGTEVTVAAPPSNEVIPFRTFLRIALDKKVPVTL
jgi:hypothetical protein